MFPFKRYYSNIYLQFVLAILVQRWFFWQLFTFNYTQQQVKIQFSINEKEVVHTCYMHTLARLYSTEHWVGEV